MFSDGPVLGIKMKIKTVFLLLQKIFREITKDKLIVVKWQVIILTYVRKLILITQLMPELGDTFVKLNWHRRVTNLSVCRSKSFLRPLLHDVSFVKVILVYITVLGPVNYSYIKQQQDIKDTD